MIPSISNKKKERLERILQPLRFFAHPSFDDPRQRRLIVGEIPGLEKFQKEKLKIRDMAKTISPEMRPCYDLPLLTVDQEQHLFRKMSYFKYRAKKLIDEVSNPNRIGMKRLERIEDLLAKAREIRNQIARSNFRLSSQILKGGLNFKEQNMGDSLLSDAYVDVLKAVDYFDWRKGFRFSTYATWVLKKNFFKGCKQRNVQAERYSRLDETSADQIESHGDGFEEERLNESQKFLVRRLLNIMADDEKKADRQRQVFILEKYFGVNGNERHTLEGISSLIGVTKERVRQLKEKGIEWLKSKVKEIDFKYEVEMEDAAI